MNLGHGETTATMLITTKLFLAVKVSYAVSNIRSGDEVVLEVLPCLSICLSIAYECYCVCKMSLCGDTDTNPGPIVTLIWLHSVVLQ